MGNRTSRKKSSPCVVEPQPAEDNHQQPANKSQDLAADPPPSNLLYNRSIKKVKSTPNMSQKNSQNGSISRQKSLRARTERPSISTNHPLSPAAREIIQSCFDNPHQDIGTRICMRMFEKRGDYQLFIYSLGKDKWPELTTAVREYLDAVIDNVGNVDAIIRLSKEYGESHVPLKSFGFKPDFWVSMTDAMTTECIYLDGAAHQPTDTIAAWSQLISLMFSAVRDGYYGLLRRERRNSRRISTYRYKNSLDVSTDGSTSSSSPVDPAADSAPSLTAGHSLSADFLDRTMSIIEQEDDTQSQIINGSTCYTGCYRSQSVL